MPKREHPATALGIAGRNAGRRTVCADQGEHPTAAPKPLRQRPGPPTPVWSGHGEIRNTELTRSWELHCRRPRTATRACRRAHRAARRGGPDEERLCRARSEPRDGVSPAGADAYAQAGPMRCPSSTCQPRSGSKGKAQPPPLGPRTRASSTTAAARFHGHRRGGFDPDATRALTGLHCRSAPPCTPHLSTGY
jgi:hypothetical protein